MSALPRMLPDGSRALVPRPGRSGERPWDGTGSQQRPVQTVLEPDTIASADPRFTGCLQAAPCQVAPVDQGNGKPPALKDTPAIGAGGL
jgi:hypothetical protein